MKHEIKAKTSVQLLSIGKILHTGDIYVHEGELPIELENAKKQGLITITKVGTPKKEPAKPEKKEEVKEEPKEETPKEEPKADEGINLDDYDLHEMNRGELDDLAVKMGLNPDDFSNMTKLRAAIIKKGRE